MKRACLVVIVGALLAAGCGGGSSGGSSSKSGATKSGHVNISIWQGYTQGESVAIKKLAAQFNASHPNITVTPQSYGNNDYALQKVLAAIAGGKPPDISYLYGSNAANIAASGKLVPLNKYVSDPSFGWSHFYKVEREVATVNGKVTGVPALVDNLALVYNKKLFAQAGISPPTADWTWSDFESAALKLTDPSKKQFGWAYVNDASEDTVWRFWAMLWQAGGKILSADNKQAAFNSPAGLKALTLLQQLAARKAIYLDNGSGDYLPVFNAGHIGMLWTGPWDLQQIAASKVSYGEQILPAAVNHQTISGPDNWVMFDNGSARVAAAWEFLKWFTSPKIDLEWCLMTGDLPIRDDVSTQPGYNQFARKYPGIDLWVKNLDNATQARPVLTTYPKISTVVGQAVQSVLLGKAQPQQALTQAAQQVNGILSAPS
jgi:multiple sugar transport system substrate-binding protein